MLAGLAADAPLGHWAGGAPCLASRPCVMKDLRPPQRPDASSRALHLSDLAPPADAPRPDATAPSSEPDLDRASRPDPDAPPHELAPHAHSLPPHELDPHALALALARAAAAGDRPAAAAFARRLLPVARKVTRALLGPAPDADDATQTALLELLESAHTYAGQGPLEAWARRIVARTTLRALRRARRLPLDPLADDDALADPPAHTTDLRDHLPRALDDYLALLPDTQRIALVLRHALDHTLPEIADLTGAPVPTVKSRVLKAEATLRKLIRRDQNLGRPAP